ncbi:MAG: DUF3857 domain-containing protein, partial [Flavobacteriaceae bacterium]|nr:DUF3857 domain-containing protein [Flavobacteriaceae bacterium]
MKFFVLLLVVGFFTLSFHAQNYKFGKVSEEEVLEKAYPLDTTVNAAVLYRRYSVSYFYRKGEGFLQRVTVHERIKLYKKEGFDWGTKKVRLYNKSNASSEDIAALKAYTYNMVDGKLEKEKMDKDATFTEVANEYWKYESFTLPNLKEGSVIEYTYEIISPFVQIDNIDLQYTIPIKKQEIRVSTPEYFVYNKMFNPRARYIPKIDISRENVTVPFSYLENVVSSEEENIPALESEPFVDNLDNYRAKLIMELSMTKFPDSPIDTYATSWEDITENIYKNSNFGQQIDRNGYYEDDLDQLITGISDPAQKMEIIYNFVKSKVKWDGFVGIYSPAGLRKAYKDGTGNSADINLMLISMMRYAGIKANPVLVSTKNHGIPLLPTNTGFNYVICLVETPEFNALLDATEEFSSINVLPSRANNWQGRLVKEDGSSQWNNLSPSFSSDDVTALHGQISPDLVVSGKVRNQLTHHLAMKHRNEYANVNKDEYRKALEKDKGDLKITDLEIENLKDAIQPVRVTYSYESNDKVEEIGDKLYFSPMLFLTNQENPFKQESRNYPIDLTHPISDKYLINIQLPEGYQVETLPENEKYQFNGEEGVFTYLVKNNGSSIQVTVSLDIANPLILSNDYQYFKDFYTL